MGASASSLVSSVLQEYGDATRAVLFDYLPSREPRRYLYDLAAEYPRRGGRAFRPSLCIATARAFGTPMEAALPTAVSIELIHNAMLIHDDIEDESDERRGKPTMHVSQGVPIAINVGDMLSLLSMRPLLRSQTCNRSCRKASIWADMWLHSIAGRDRRSFLPSCKRKASSAAASMNSFIRTAT